MVCLKVVGLSSEDFPPGLSCWTTAFFSGLSQPEGRPIQAGYHHLGIWRYALLLSDRLVDTFTHLFQPLPGLFDHMFDHPKTLFDGGNLGDTAPQYALNITPKAGDVVIITELTAHGALRWQAKDRKRCTLILRYTLQYLGGTGGLSDTLRERLSPETQELMARGGYQEIKEIVHRDVVNLS